MSAAAADAGGKVVLVTGATSGIGLETARGLVRAGAHVVVGARNRTRGEAATADLARTGPAELMLIDLGSFASVRSAARAFAASHDRLDVLVNNAGIATRRREIGPDGHELTWTTNFLGSFLLTHELLPLLVRTRAPRVVNVSSAAHATARWAWDDLESAKDFGTFRAYARSKLAQILFTRELARREPGIWVAAVHPGAIATNIWRAAPAWARLLLQMLLPGPRRGAAPVIALAHGPITAPSGGYFHRMEPREPAEQARGDEDAARLWSLAEHATGVGG